MDISGFPTPPIERRWGGSGYDGRYVEFTEGEFKGRKAFLDRLEGDCFYSAIDPLNGEELYGYLSEFEFLKE